MPKRTVNQLPVEGKRVLVRVDFNVPLDKAGKIGDDARIRAALPTIEHLVQRKARVILMSHLGRPKKKDDASHSMKAVASRLSELIGQRAVYVRDCIGQDVEEQLKSLGPGQVALLENLRFHAGEEANDPAFAAALSRLADFYVNDAFGAAHRAHASVSSEMTSRLPSAAGFLMAKEVEYLELALRNPPRPFFAVLGGAKVADKIPIITNLLTKVDGLLIGGGMAFTFHKAKGYRIGASILDESSRGLSANLMRDAEARKVALLLPSDYIIVDPNQKEGRPKTQAINMPEPGIPDGMAGVDIGPETRAQFVEKLQTARCILWNGPMGIFEVPEFAAGTHSLAQAISELTARKVVTILGGGDTAAAARKLGFVDFSHVSTGGGASLEFLSGIELPGIKAIPDRD